MPDNLTSESDISPLRCRQRRGFFMAAARGSNSDMRPDQALRAKLMAASLLKSMGLTR
jgi:hypothetical protein